MKQKRYTTTLKYNYFFNYIELMIVAKKRYNILALKIIFDINEKDKQKVIEF